MLIRLDRNVRTASFAGTIEWMGSEVRHHEHGEHRQHEPGRRHRDRLRPGRLLGAARELVHPHSHEVTGLDGASVAGAGGMRALALSLGGLAATAGVQLIVLVLSGSVALLADTIHNFADALTAVPLGVAFWLGRRPASRRYTYGYGRSEDLAGIFVVMTVAASAAVAGYEAIDRLLHPAGVGNVGWVAVAGVVGFLGNELVARYRITVGRRIGSAALEADGHHARTDGLTSLGVVAGAIGVALGWQAADPFFGLLITATILVVVRSAARDVYRRLMDAVDPQLVDQVEGLLQSTPGVMSVDAVRLRWIGHRLHAESDVTSDARLSLPAAHDVAEVASHRLLHGVRRLGSATIHVSPSATEDHDPHALTAHHAGGVT